MIQSGIWKCSVVRFETVSVIDCFASKWSLVCTALTVSLEFRIGQLYNSERDELSNVAVSDPIQTTLTTRGYLSNGNSDPITINGQYGDDFFDVLRNLDIVDLNGESGDDTFVIRSFVAVIREDGSLGESGVKKVKARGNDGNDEFQIGDVNPEAQGVAYVVNSLVDIDGGTGNDQ